MEQKNVLSLDDINVSLEHSLLKGVITKFQCQVYRKLLEVPKGKVTTYRDLGNSISCKSSQAIGQALKRNPFAPQVPCHRVVRSDYSVGGFSSSTSDESVSKKIKLLKDEGVAFEELCREKGEGLERCTRIRSQTFMHKFSNEE